MDLTPRELATKVVAGVGLVVAGCSELRESRESIRLPRSNRRQADGTATGNPTSTGTGSPAKTKTPSSGPAATGAPTGYSDPTRSATAGSRSGALDGTAGRSGTAGSTGTTDADGTAAAGGSGATDRSANTGGIADSNGGGGAEVGTDPSGPGTAPATATTTATGPTTATGTAPSTATPTATGTAPSTATPTATATPPTTATADGADGTTDGPALVVDGGAVALPYSARRSVSVGSSEVRYLCDADLPEAFVSRYSFGAADGRPLNCSLLAHDQLEALLAGEDHSTLLSFTGLPAFEMGPFTLAGGRYAIVVEQADATATDPVDVTVEFELLAGA